MTDRTMLSGSHLPSRWHCRPSAWATRRRLSAQGRDAGHPFEPGRRQRRVPARDDASISASRSTRPSSSRTCRAAAAPRRWPRVATAPPDGSIFYATTPTYIYTSLLSAPEHTYKDLEPLVNFFTDSEVVYTRADGPFKTLADVIDHAKKARGQVGRRQPGLARAPGGRAAEARRRRQRRRSSPTRAAAT